MGCPYQRHLFCSDGISWDASLLSWMRFIHSSSSPSEDHTSHHHITWGTPTQRPSGEQMSLLLLKSIFDSQPVVEPCRLVRRGWGLGKPPSPTFHALKRPARKAICDQSSMPRRGHMANPKITWKCILHCVQGICYSDACIYGCAEKNLKGQTSNCYRYKDLRKQSKYCFLCMFLLWGMQQPSSYLFIRGR